MPKVDKLLHEVEALSTGEKWELVRLVLNSLEHEQTRPSETIDWHQFLRETYGSLRDAPIQRYEAEA